MAGKYSKRSKKYKGSSKSKYTKKVVVDAQAARQLQVYRYPFSTATSNPKIPDGKLTQSFGIKVQKMHRFKKRIANPGTNSIDETFDPTWAGQMIIALYPGFGTVGSVSDGSLTSGGIHYNELKTGNFTDIAGGVKFSNIGVDGIVGSYRIVSQALKLRCVSSDDHNDGYWQAVRVPMNRRSKDFCPRLGADAATSFMTAHFKPSVLNEHFKEINWLTNPTYQSGKIKNLGQYEFRLQPQKIEHDMIDIPSTVEYKADQFDNHYEKVDDAIDITHTYDFITDDQWDMILIKIQGKPETEILAHFVQNVEFTPQTNVASGIYQSETVDAGKLLKMRQMDYKKEERLPGKYVGGPRNS